MYVLNPSKPAIMNHNAASKQTLNPFFPSPTNHPPPHNLHISLNINLNLDPHQMTNTDTATNKRTASDILHLPQRIPIKLSEHHRTHALKKHKAEKKQTDFRCNFSHSLKDFIDEHKPNYPLNSQQLENFIENSLGSKDLLIIAKDYTYEPLAIITMLDEIRPQLTGRKMKTRCTKLKTRLLKQIITGNIDTESDSSIYQSHLQKITHMSPLIVHNV
ncbi:hypothetical protein JTB14_009335 [Gonioctena quinquepunctata]|nr:hypothetical protein JTB14_009335 [Gonioctena quinquepunctata]